VSHQKDRPTEIKIQISQDFNGESTVVSSNKFMSVIPPNFLKINPKTITVLLGKN